MVSYRDTFVKKSLKVKSIVNTRTGYGFILSGSSKVLKEDIKSYIGATQSSILDYVATLEKEIPVIQAKIDGEEINDLFSADTVIFKNSVKYMGIAIAGLVFCGIIYEICRRIKNKVVPVATEKESLHDLSSHVSGFFGSTFKNEINKLCKRHEDQLTQLVLLQSTYERSVSNIGKYRTDEIVDGTFDKVQ